MLNAGSCVSILSQDTAQKVTGIRLKAIPPVQASGESLLIMDYINVDVQLNKIESVVFQ